MRFEGREGARSQNSVFKKRGWEGARKPTEPGRKSSDSDPVRRNGNEENFIM